MFSLKSKFLQAFFCALVRKLGPEPGTAFDFYRVLLHGRLTDGWLVQNPFGPRSVHKDPYGPIWARAHAVREAISVCCLFWEKTKRALY